MDYRQVTVHPESHIAPNATLVGQVEVAKDATILFNATLRGDYGSRIVVGEGSNVQENSCLLLDFNQDCIVGRGVTIGHGAVVHGCTLGDNVLVGMGAVVMNGAVIGANSLVAAGALVTEGTQVPEGSLVVGVPAKVRRQLTLEEIEGNRERPGAMPPSDATWPNRASSTGAPTFPPTRAPSRSRRTSGQILRAASAQNCFQGRALFSFWTKYAPSEPQHRTLPGFYAFTSLVFKESLT